MPEGPSIIILKEAVEPFRGQRINKASGNSTKIVMDELKGKAIRDFKSWGKHFLVCFEDSYIRIHFLLFGSYRINERREMSPRLSLETTKGELNFYACSVQMKSGSPDDVYDWSACAARPGYFCRGGEYYQE
jgi:endonuclease-8